MYATYKEDTNFVKSYLKIQKSSNSKSFKDILNRNSDLIGKLMKIMLSSDGNLPFAVYSIFLEMLSIQTDKAELDFNYIKFVHKVVKKSNTSPKGRFLILSYIFRLFSMCDMSEEDQATFLAEFSDIFHLTLLDGNFLTFFMFLQSFADVFNSSFDGIVSDLFQDNQNLVSSLKGVLEDQVISSVNLDKRTIAKAETLAKESRRIWRKLQSLPSATKSLSSNVDSSKTLLNQVVNCYKRLKEDIHSKYHQLSEENKTTLVQILTLENDSVISKLL
eukprot:TRINITY_DN7548_c1_g1_i1.p1 TRINITY_DN7548_c1_g1~~TRINITY_DN7548_c1_g1_i1.p1  ORF type:complete len:275 (+),score=35.20 TRINITY_DN7548_c1_g1_i1:563-1387(+)